MANPNETPSPVQISAEGLWYIGPDLSAWRLDHPDGLAGFPLRGGKFTVNDRTWAMVHALLVLAMQRLDALNPEWGE